MTTRNRSQTKDAAALRATIGTETARLCAERYGVHLRAVVLTGSLARDEATWRTDGIKWSALGDAEFRSDAAKAQLEIEPLTGNEIDNLLATAYSTPKPIVQKAAALVEPSTRAP